MRLIPSNEIFSVSSQKSYSTHKHILEEKRQVFNIENYRKYSNSCAVRLIKPCIYFGEWFSEVGLLFGIKFWNKIVVLRIFCHQLNQLFQLSVRVSFLGEVIFCLF
jgi:hypothetical protein